MTETPVAIDIAKMDLDALLDAAAAMDSLMLDGIVAACLDLYIPKIKTRRRSWKQCDVARALRAAKAAGFLVRVEIEPDGRIVLVPVLCGPEFFSGEIEHGNLPEEKPLSRPRDKIGA
jgi:hypothetical protein